MRRLLVLLSLFAPCAIAQPAAAPDSPARSMAKAAYNQIFQHPFEPDVWKEAAEKIDHAHSVDDRESWVYVAAARLTFNVGYHSGDRTKATSYEAGALDAVAALLKHAIELDPSVVTAHSDLAWIDIVQRKFPDAQHELFEAHKLAPDDFRVWYVQSVSWWMQGNAAKSETALEGAKSRAKTVADQLSILDQRERMAVSRDDSNEVESILREFIRLQPNWAWAYGNYGNFLVNHGRYDEAVVQLEKAVKLAPYPIAVNLLAEAKRMRDAAHARK